jgi:hypothetical protein
VLARDSPIDCGENIAEPRCASTRSTLSYRFSFTADQTLSEVGWR